MGIPILIVGETGSGKSTSFRNVSREHTAFFNCEGKPLPFRNNKFAMIGNVPSTTILAQGMSIAEKKDNITLGIVDSISMMADMVYRELIEGADDGFSGWAKYKKKILEIIEFTKRSKKNYVFTALEERSSGNNGDRFVASVQGSLKGKLESHFSIVLRAMTLDDMESPTGVRHVFATNRIPGEIITAKSPIGMFENQFVDNDIVMVLKTISEFYNE